jgi:modulator of FtsH protease HflC
MKKTITILVIIAIVLILLFVIGPFYVVEEGEQAVVTRFGEIVYSTRNAGLKFKVPLVDTVVTYPKKILSWDGDPRRIPTKENQFIWVDTTARWKIDDPVQFYERLNKLDQAYSRLDDIIESAVRTIISENSLSESVRSSDIINEKERTVEELIPEEGTGQIENIESIEEIAQFITINIQQPSVEKGREKLSIEMYKSASRTTKDFGVRLIDIVIRQIRYSDDLTESVYNRMISERKQIAEAYRSYGEGRKQELLGQLEKEKETILSEAYAESERIRGNADAEVITIYANAYNRDREFFRFWRAIESYKKTMPQFSKTLATDMEYFDFLYNAEGE